MATVNYTLRLDEADKQTAEQIFSQLGLTLAAGLNVYVKAVVRQKKIPFELSTVEQPIDKESADRKKRAITLMEVLDNISSHEHELSDTDWSDIEHSLESSRKNGWPDRKMEL